MILPILCVSLLTWPSSKCEPPVNSYLPPTNNAGDIPSTQYGSPKRIGGSDLQSNQAGTSGFGQSPQNSYLPPGQSSASNPNTQYGTPESGNFGRNSHQSGAGGRRPNTQYGSPNQGIGPSSRLTDNQYSLPGGNGDSSYNNRGESRSPGFDRKPDSSYGAPNSDVHSPNSQTHSGGFVPNQEQARGEGQSSRLRDGFGGRPASPSASYGVPGPDGPGERRPNFGEGDSDAPANYAFNYDVDDSQTGTKFGHSEKRDGDLATGEYNVVLPDGRKQVVEYEAGLDGFKPQIRYEGTPHGGSEGRNGAYHRSNSGNGFPESNHDQPGALGQYQDANTYENGPGYPSGRPGNGNNGQRNGYSSGRPNQRVPGQDYPGSNNGLEGSDGDNQGHPHCLNRNTGSPQERGCSGPGAGNGRPRNYYNGGPHSEEGYPSGRPNGPTGTGY